MHQQQQLHQDVDRARLSISTICENLGGGLVELSQIFENGGKTIQAERCRELADQQFACCARLNDKRVQHIYWPDTL